jgi:hypothetical protein
LLRCRALRVVQLSLFMRPLPRAFAAVSGLTLLLACGGRGSDPSNEETTSSNGGQQTAGGSNGNAAGQSSGGSTTSTNGGSTSNPNQSGGGGMAGGSGGSAQDDPDDANPFDPNNPSDPTPLTKAEDVKVYAHVMPWFETAESAGGWGIHWTMNTRNPDVMDGDGKRQIASHFYPLTGPYASGDRDIVEYQLLLMKYSGIDGVLIDWPGTIDHFDYARNRQNAEVMIDLTAEVGLSFAVVYEDRNVRIAGEAGVISDWNAAARADMEHVRDQYFSQPNHIRVDGAPLLLAFGPQTFETPAAWADIFSVLPEKPRFLTLWYEAEDAGEHAGGEYAWVFENNSHLDEFYARGIPGLKMGSAYPGYQSYYAEGGWDGPTWIIAHDDVATFAETLDKALNAGVEHLQLTTWNDYGEGTMIEPTREFEFRALTTLQQKLGVNFGEDELRLILSLYEQRKEHAGNDAKQAELDQAFDALAQLRIDDARLILE